MFWKKKPSSENQDAEKLPGPKEIPEAIGAYLVVERKENPDWVWNLKAVIRGRPEDKHSYDFRVFSDSKASEKKINVRNYNHLGEFPDLILYAGRFDKKTRQVQIEITNRP